MTDAKGFLKYPRETPPYRPVEERVRDFRDVADEAFSEVQTRRQAARCMNCGVPFCHQGCPLGNVIPEFNEAVLHGDWALAYRILDSTNNFPEFTGRICPAPCEHACVLNINQPAVAIEHIEKSIIETAFENGWVRPKPPHDRTGKKVAIIGSGPAGLAAAAELNREGHSVTVFEKDERPGGLLRFGIPDFKLEKWVVERRIALMEAEGIRFLCNTTAGVDITGDELLQSFDAVVVCTGAQRPRQLQLPGRDSRGIYPAMDYLTQSNRRVMGACIPEEDLIDAAGKHVIVIGGGDTGSDCVGTANRQGALSVTQLQYRERPADTRPEDAWPNVPLMFTASSSHEEGCTRQWAVQAKAFISDANGCVRGLLVCDISWEKDPATGKHHFVEIPGSDCELPCDLALIAIGYSGAEPSPLWSQLGLTIDEKGTVVNTNYITSSGKVFVAGDARRGQSLVVWAIAEGREVSRIAGERLRRAG